MTEQTTDQAQVVDAIEIPVESLRDEVPLIKELADAVMGVAQSFQEAEHDFVSIAATILFVAEGLRQAFPFLNDIQFEQRSQEAAEAEQGEA